MLANSKRQDSLRKETLVVSDTKRKATPSTEALNEKIGENVREKSQARSRKRMVAKVKGRD